MGGGRGREPGDSNGQNHRALAATVSHLTDAVQRFGDVSIRMRPDLT
jgi:hypothetical protein